MMQTLARRLAGLLAIAVLTTGCASDDADDVGRDDGGQRYPDVVDVTVETDGDAYTFRVTISSPYDSPERYADGWRVMGPDGTVYGEHTLVHDHASEQPFTRAQSGVSIPADVDEVVIEGRDSEYGYGGTTRSVMLP